MGKKKVDKDGLMIEVNTAAIDEGRFLEQFDTMIRDGHRDLAKYADRTGRHKGKVKITATVELVYDEELEGQVLIACSVKKVVPQHRQVCAAKEAGGRMLVQQGGATRDNPDQMRMFTPSGVLVGSVNLATGEVQDDEPAEPAVAGKVGATAS